MSAQALFALGWLICHESRTFIWNQIFNHESESTIFFDASAWELQQDCCLALLHFDCGDLSADINELIDNCRGKNVFAEHNSALAVKSGRDAQSILELSKNASLDCFQGVILGTGLNDLGKQLFEEEVLPNLDLIGDSGGNTTATYIALCFRGYSLFEIKEIWTAESSSSQLLDHHDKRLSYGMIADIFQIVINDPFTPVAGAQGPNHGCLSLINLCNSLETECIELCNSCKSDRSTDFLERAKSFSALEQQATLQLKTITRLNKSKIEISKVSRRIWRLRPFCLRRSILVCSNNSEFF